MLNNKSKNLELVLLYLKELELIRDIIVHAYLFEGEILVDDNHDIIGLSEKAVGGQHKDRAVKRLTPKLKLHVAPNQFSFKNFATFYIAFTIILEDAGLKTRDAMWKWTDGSWKDSEEWLDKAMRNLHYDQSTVWKTLNEQLSSIRYSGFDK